MASLSNKEKILALVKVTNSEGRKEVINTDNVTRIAPYTLTTETGCVVHFVTGPALLVKEDLINIIVK